MPVFVNVTLPVAAGPPRVALRADAPLLVMATIEPVTERVKLAEAAVPAGVGVATSVPL